MATIVQPYNPWKEQLALTALGKVAGDIIGDIWKSHRQNEQNRKANAFRGQLQENLAQQGNTSLTPPEAPKGYNSNPWAYALHQNYSPLTQFDIGTAGVTPKAPTIQDIAQGADSLAATPRFSMLSPELVQGVKNSMMQQAENQRLRDLQDNFANMFRNATTPAEQMRALTEANIYGFGDKAITPLSAFAIHSTPHHTLHEVRTGDQVRMVDYNPFDGQMAERGAYNIGLSPDVREQTAAQREVARTNAAAHQYGYDVTARQNQQELEHKRITDNLTQLDNELKALETEYQNRMQELQGITDKNEAEAYRQRYIEPLITRKNNLLANQSELRNMLWNNMGLSTGNPNNGQNSGATSGGDLGDLSYWGETSNGMGKDIHGKPFDYSSLINKYSKLYGIDPDFAAAVMHWESGGDPNALSNKGAVGLFQLMPNTAKGLKSSRGHTINPHDIEDNIEGGILYLKQMYDKYHGNPELILRAYNAGPGATDAGRYPEQTRKYVPGVLNIYRRFRSRRPQQQTPTQGSSTPQTQQPQQGNTQGQTQGQNTDRIMFRNKEGTFITQSEFDEILKQGAKEGLGPNGVAFRLRRKGFERVPEANNNNVIRVPSALNWSPSYMGRLPQGQAITGPVTSEFPVSQQDISNNDSGDNQVHITAFDWDNQPFPDNFSDKNRNNHPTQHSGNPHAGVNPMWSFYNRANSNTPQNYSTQITALNDPLHPYTFGADITPQLTVLNGHDTYDYPLMDEYRFKSFLQGLGIGPKQYFWEQGY